jgi:hypothetical protein
MKPSAPIYIPSRGRADSRLTVRALDALGLDYHVVVEADEHAQYARVIDAARLLVLDPSYQREYDTFDRRDDDAPKGSGPARNFIWDHALASGAAWHWIMDDNIRAFRRMQHNVKIKLLDGTAFKAMEDFAQQYENVALAGPNYRYFADQRALRRPMFLNTRVYSCILIRNDLPFRWRGRFNEDTDLSLRVLKAGWCTVLFNAFLQDKQTTLSMRGGNTDTIYVDGTLAKSQQLVAMHPDVARLVWKYHRWHHYVDYRPFKANRLVRRTDAPPLAGNDYGMRLITIDAKSAAHER